MDIEQRALAERLFVHGAALKEHARYDPARPCGLTNADAVSYGELLEQAAAALKSAPATEASEVTEAIALEWLIECDNLVVLHSTPADAWQVRRASSGEVRGSGGTPFEALRAAMLAARVAREG